MLFHKHKLLFTGITKNASSSVFAILSNKTDCQHHHASYLEDLNENAEDLASTYFSFAIVRNPYDWISSFFKKKHHQHSRCNLSFERFILDEFFSDDGEIELKDKEGNFLDRKENNERFKNIFEMRDYKNRYALEVLPNILNNYYIVRYEDLLENTEQILHELRFKFNLPKRIDEYVIDKINPSVKHIPDHINQIIKNNLNEELENKLGYSI